MRHAIVTGTQMAIGAMGATAAVGISTIITLGTRHSIESSVDKKKTYYTDMSNADMIFNVITACDVVDYMLQTLISDLGQGIWIADHTQFEGLHEFSLSCEGTSLSIVIDLDDEIVKPIYRSNGNIISVLDALSTHRYICSNIRILLRVVK